MNDRSNRSECSEHQVHHIPPPASPSPEATTDGLHPRDILREALVRALGLFPEILTDPEMIPYLPSDAILVPVVEDVRDRYRAVISYLESDYVSVLPFADVLSQSVRHEYALTLWISSHRHSTGLDSHRESLGAGALMAASVSPPSESVAEDDPAVRYVRQFVITPSMAMPGTSHAVRPGMAAPTLLLIDPENMDRLTSGGATGLPIEHPRFIQFIKLRRGDPLPLGRGGNDAPPFK